MPDHFCPPDHSHGANSTCRSAHGCKCDDCRRFAREYEYWRAGQRRRGRDLLIDATGAHRRIRALQAIGWSGSLIGVHAGHTESWVCAVLRAKRVSKTTRAKVVAVYEKLSMTPPPRRTPSERSSADRAMRYARRAGWAPPLAWDDEHLDDPTASPYPHAA